MKLKFNPEYQKLWQNVRTLKGKSVTETAFLNRENTESSTKMYYLHCDRTFLLRWAIQSKCLV